MASTESLLGIYPPLSDDQAAKVAQLGARVSAVPTPESYRAALDRHPALFLAKWLYARKWSVDDAAGMYEKAAQWRLHHRLDTRALFPAMRPARGYDEAALQAMHGRGQRKREAVDLTEDAFSDISPARWHFWDRDGRPVLIERTGLVQSDKLVERCHALARPGERFTKRYTDYDVQVNEIGSALVQHRNRQHAESGATEVDQVTVVMDLKHLSVAHLNAAALKLVTASTDLAQRYYPEGLHRVLCVNSPSIAKVAWAVMVPFLDKRVQEKVSFHREGDDTRNALDAVVGLERTPAFLGGQCECAGGCVPVAGDAGAPDRWAGVDKKYLTRLLHVGSGKEAQAAFEVTEAPGTRLRWALHVDAYDVSYYVRLQPAQGADSEEVALGGAPKAVHGEGVVEVDEAWGCSRETPCTLHVEADNRYSWVHGKDVRWRVEPEAVYAAAMAEDAANRDARHANPDPDGF